jgi:hypothetical protein
VAEVSRLLNHNHSVLKSEQECECSHYKGEVVENRGNGRDEDNGWRHGGSKGVGKSNGGGEATV